jgi:hypothetical protein
MKVRSPKCFAIACSVLQRIDESARAVAQKRRIFIITALLTLWHFPEVSIIDLTNQPCVMILCILEKLLVLFERTSTSFWRICLMLLASKERNPRGGTAYPSPPSCKPICRSEHQKQPIFQAIEPNWCQQCNCKVC